MSLGTFHENLPKYDLIWVLFDLTMGKNYAEMGNISSIICVFGPEIE